MKTYTSTEIQRKAKISKIQAVHWTQVGAIIPLQDVRGRGRSRVYSWQNLIEFAICRELNKYSIESQLMKRVLDWLRHPECCLYIANPSKRDVSDISDDELVQLIIHGKAGPGDRQVSFWELLRLRPNTDQVFLRIYYDDYEGKTIFQLYDAQQLKSWIDHKNVESTVVVNIRAIINRLGQEE